MLTTAWWRTLWDPVIAVTVASVAVQYAETADVLIGCGMAAALVARRYAPLRVLAVIAVLGFAQVVVSLHLPAGYDLAVPVAAVTAVVYAPVRRGGPAAAVVLAAAAGALSAVDLVRRGGLWNLTVLDMVRDSGTPQALAVMDLSQLARDSVLPAYTGFGALIWLLAYAYRSNREQAAALAERVATAERERDQLTRLAAVEERLLIARELHDVVAHGLAVMTVQADGAGFVVDRDPESARRALHAIAQTGRAAIEDMRHIVGVLRGGHRDDSRTRTGLADLDTIVGQARDAGLAVTLDRAGDPGPLTAAEELTVVRIIQESLTNALKHAGPGAAVTVRLTYAPGSVGVQVGDDGHGRLEHPAPAPGHGLTGMRERVAVHGGEFTAGPYAASGWQVTARIPTGEPA